MRLRRFLIGLSLIAALSATPARQAEAAADLARTMAELGGADRVEAEDGGVGDDVLEAPRGDAAASPAVAWALTLALNEARPLPGTVRLRPLPGPIRRFAATDRPGHPAPPGERCAWLQRFLF